jgi:hypothetical protein
MEGLLYCSRYGQLSIPSRSEQKYESIGIPLLYMEKAHWTSTYTYVCFQNKINFQGEVTLRHLSLRTARGWAEGTASRSRASPAPTSTCPRTATWPCAVTWPCAATWPSSATWTRSSTWPRCWTWSCCSLVQLILTSCCCWAVGQVESCSMNSETQRSAMLLQNVRRYTLSLMSCPKSNNL